MTMTDAKKVRLDDYDSDFEEDEDRSHKRAKREDLTSTQDQPSTSKNIATHASGLPGRSTFDDEQRRADAYKYSYLSLNAFERHKKLINEYFLYYPGSKERFKRDSSKDKTDHDIIRDHHRFIWDEDEDLNTWEKHLTKKYYDKLFKEYCICDLSFYQQGKYAMRWRTETEVINGKGQFICGARKCVNSENLRSWEVNFAYMEESIKKNALVKLRLCSECSVKLNHHQKRKDVTRIPKKKKKKHKKGNERKHKKATETSTSEEDLTKVKIEDEEKSAQEGDSNIWKEPVQVTDVKTREEEFDDYLDDLFL